MWLHLEVKRLFHTNGFWYKNDNIDFFLFLFFFFFFFFFLYRTLSNWVIELDKWAPSIVKIAYKVAIDFYYHYVLLL